MFSIQKTILAVLLVLGLFSCNQKSGENVTEEGIRYTNHINGKGEKADSASIYDVKYQIFYKEDSLAMGNYEGLNTDPVGITINELPFLKEPLKDAVSGDSLSVRVPAKLFFKNQEVPDNFSPEELIRMELKIEGIYPLAQYNVVRQARMKAAMERQEALLQKVRYVNHTNLEGELSDSESIFELYYTMYINGDSLIAGTYNNNNEPRPFSAKSQPYLRDYLGKAIKGDSVTVYVPAALIFAGAQRLPEGVSLEDEIRMETRVAGIYTRSEYQEIFDQRQKPKEDKAIQKYLADNNLEGKRTESGLYYVIEKQGKTEGIKEGDMLKVHYRGTLLDGTPFDNSYDRGEPLPLPIMTGRVIPGWDEGIPLIGIGGKGTLLIPSHLGYGSRGSQPIIKPYSTLKFEVEVLDEEE